MDDKARREAEHQRQCREMQERFKGAGEEFGKSLGLIGSSAFFIVAILALLWLLS